MKPALLDNKLHYPDNWQQMPMGERILQLSNAHLSEKCRQFFGYQLVQLGQLSCQLDLTCCPIKHQILQTTKACEGSTLVSKATSLPYQENSIDAFVLAHELDFARDPHQILREVHYALIPEGHVVISGFNPFSLAGLRRLIPLKKHPLLHQARFFRAARIKDWLQLLGFEILSDQRFLFAEMLWPKLAESDGRIQRFSERYLPLLGSVYMIVARKRESTLTMIKPKWQMSRKFSPVGASVQALHRESR
ncbi:class I SAM-dependent methyltransferase [Neptunicella marina]|uniref:Methyltransferase domain-containing protein n=1 Tax=Neptunicella marina TaxID=2125989 RepID=A0A8J6IRI4_9ALTE|nr:methyltransferase domain-containing protein [Neptunicella marina]MBC3764475.1 methyltransferase domain-containing protein [Neptunicella marina]